MAPRDDEPTDAQSTAVAPGYTTSATVAATFQLSVVGGPDTGRTIVVSPSRPSALLIGFSGSCDLKLSDRHVSRRHAAVDVTGSRLELTDLGSTNGTFVNDIPVTGAFLRGGEQLRIGETTIDVIQLDSATVVHLPTETSYGRVIGGSAEMRRLYPLCDKLAAANIAVLIEGETGTGKELVAESLHEKGPRASAPFVVFDCTAVSRGLVESELFGHERGAFTGAVTARKGVFEQANGGTLLIDEIGDLETSLQPKLLRALERSEIRRVGGDALIKVDVRILSATRRNLDHEVQAGRFRDDLFHRLAVARVALPPLRQRRGDIGLLARMFAKQLGTPNQVLPESVLMSWEDYTWPGNVRELRNAVMRYLALGEADVGGDIEEPRLDAHTSASARSEGALEAVLGMNLPYSIARQRVLVEFERHYVTRVLAEHGGNVLRAAAASGIARRHLQRVRARSQK